MASAKKTVKSHTVKRTVVVEDVVTEDTVTLELTTYEALVLRAILNRIGGSPEGPRGQADKITEALDDAEVRAPGFRTDALFTSNRSSIIFDNLTQEEFNRIYRAGS